MLIVAGTPGYLYKVPRHSTFSGNSVWISALKMATGSSTSLTVHNQQPRRTFRHGITMMVKKAHHDTFRQYINVGRIVMPRQVTGEVQIMCWMESRRKSIRYAFRWLPSLFIPCSGWFGNQKNTQPTGMHLFCSHFPKEAKQPVSVF